MEGVGGGCGDGGRGARGGDWGTDHFGVVFLLAVPVQ